MTIRPLSFVNFCIAAIILSSCGNPESSDANSSSKEEHTEAVDLNEDAAEVEGSTENVSIVGKWKLTKVEGDRVEEGTIDECDFNTIWNFTDKPAEPLSDGTEVFTLIATPTEDCKFRDFEAKWTELEKSVFMSTSRVGGVGGLSHAGLFEVIEKDTDHLVLFIFGTTYSFKRIS